MQRVRIGVTGLAAVFLLVILAAALIGTLHRDTSARIASAGSNAHAPADTPKEPLAELGVAPGNAQPAGGEGNAAAPATPTGSAAAPAPAPATNPSVAAAPAPAGRSH